MKLSLRAEYALQAMIALGDSYDGEVVPMQVVSQLQQIPKRFLEQILNDLRAGGFVESKRGIAGGYRLARPMREITVAEVVRHFEGPLTPLQNPKQLRVNTPAGGAQQAIRSVMKEVRNAIVGVLDHVTIADLFEKSRQFQGDALRTPDYVI